MIIETRMGAGARMNEEKGERDEWMTTQKKGTVN